MEPRDLFEILVRDHIDSVRAFLLSSLRDSVAAEDVLQETFLVAWRILDRYDRQLPFGPWVRGIAGKLLLNHRRKLMRTKLYFCDEEALTYLEDSFTGFQSLRADSFDELRNQIQGNTFVGGAARYYRVNCTGWWIEFNAYIRKCWSNSDRAGHFLYEWEYYTVYGTAQVYARMECVYGVCAWR